ncbi:MAG: Cupin 2 conserved barrel domain protein [Bacteroidetes bacterium]|nr:Cupin 2 conserved barrel domain protein [Bacteroidota bacterium]
MAHKGLILENPVTGDIYEFLETANDTVGQRTTIKMTLHTKGELVPDHFHVLQDEHFEVLSGDLTIKLDGKTHTLTSGQKMALPKNIPHNHYNFSDKPVIFTQTVSPGLDIEHLFETLIGLTKDGKVKNGKAGLVQELVILKYLDSKAYLAGMPVGVQKVLMNTVAPLARMMGYRAVYQKYSGLEK